MRTYWYRFKSILNYHPCRKYLTYSLRFVICLSLIAFFIVLLFPPASVTAQTINLQGFVTDGSTGQPLENSNIVLQKIPDNDFQGTITDRNGFYFFSGIESGSYALRISYLGFEAYEDTLVLGDAPQKTLNIVLERSEEALDAIRVEAYAVGGMSRQSVGVQRVTTAELRRAPTPAGSGDLASYLQTLPGVVAAGDRGGQLFIRGGTPSQNMVLIDGALIYQPFHIVGFFSAFPQDLVVGADFYAGGFGSRYSGRLSSVIDVQMKEGSRYRNSGSASLSPFVAEVMAEGPIDEGISSWIASVRRSLIEHTSPVFLPEKQPLKFESHFFKFSHSEDDVRCSASLLHTYDRGRMDFDMGDNVRWSNIVLGGRCLYVPGGTDFLREVNLSISRLGNSMNVGHSELFSNVTRTSIDIHTMRMSGRAKIDYGMFIVMKFLNYDMQELFFTPQTLDTFISGTGLYLDAELNIGQNFSIVPGGVFTFYPGTFNPGIEPRMRASWKPFGRNEEELSAAFGLYRQPLVGVADRRDASSVFTGWMLPPIGSSQKEAIHAMVGWGQTLGAGFQWSVEGFHKWIRNQPVPTWSTNAQFSTELANANGTVYGGDIRLDYNSRSIYGSLGYGYTFTEYSSAQDHFSLWYNEPIQSFHPPHDRRHQINLQIGFELQKYSFNVGWQLGTGLPFTQPMGFDEYIRYGNGLPDVVDSYGFPRMIMDKPYQARMPAYHRLDISAERLFNIKNAGLRLQAGAVNVYDRSNIFYYDIYTHQRIDQFPFAPYFSLKLEVR